MSAADRRTETFTATLKSADREIFQKIKL